MSVFLRWGIFGILGTAAIIYAYNVAKDMGEKRAARAAAVPVATAEPGAAGPTPAEPSPAEPAPAATSPPHCEAELEVAQRALEARRQGEPLDRLLRAQEIAWQEPLARRQRLEKVATRWSQLEGSEPIPEVLRIAVISDCVQFSPAP